LAAALVVQILKIEMFIQLLVQFLINFLMLMVDGHQTTKLIVNRHQHSEDNDSSLFFDMDVRFHISKNNCAS
jgi:hypothetical protein